MSPKLKVISSLQRCCDKTKISAQISISSGGGPETTFHDAGHSLPLDFDCCDLKVYPVPLSMRIGDQDGCQARRNYFDRGSDRCALTTEHPSYKLWAYRVNHDGTFRVDTSGLCRWIVDGRLANLSCRSVGGTRQH